MRSLPNGVCDTFNTRTGIYTQRIKEKVLNGGNSESWTKSSSFTGTSCIRFQLSLSDAYVSKNTIISIANDKFPNYPNSSWQEDVEQVNIDIQNKMSLNILKTKLTSEDVSGIKTWLSQNPLTIQYELATPIITKINLLSTLKSWNTTTHIYSEIPENTLYPTLSHSNPTYPVIIKPSTKYSIVANSYWLSQNPLTIQYELATPIITKINLLSTLKSWNTTTHIYSEIPENTLYPTLSHSNPTYPVIIKPSTKYSIVANSYSNGHTNSAIIYSEIPENTLYPTLSHSNPTYPVIIKPSTKYSIVANSYSNGHTNSAINFNLGGATVSTTVGNRLLIHTVMVTRTLLSTLI